MLKIDKSTLRTTSFFISKLIKEAREKHGIKELPPMGLGTTKYWYHLNKDGELHEDLASSLYQSAIVMEEWELLGQYRAWTAHELMIMLPDEIKHKTRGYFDLTIKKSPKFNKFFCGYQLKEFTDHDHICEALGRVYVNLIKAGYIK